MSNSREQFEAWVSGRTVCKKYGAKLNKDSAGSYRDYRINDRWLAWQASREVVVVELPNTECFGEYSQEAASNMRDSCAEAIEEQGLNYKVLP